MPAGQGGGRGRAGPGGGGGLCALHYIIARAADLSGNPILSWLLGTGAAFVLGLLVGLVLAALAALAARVRRPATSA